MACDLLHRSGGDAMEGDKKLTKRDCWGGNDITMSEAGRDKKRKKTRDFSRGAAHQESQFFNRGRGQAKREIGGDRVGKKGIIQEGIREKRS